MVTRCKIMFYTEDVKAKTREFLERYGDKGYLLLKIALEITYDPEIDHRLGDFSYKHIVFKLQRLGINYSPQNLLRILEKEYGLIEKTYISTTQKWWKFIDPETVKQVLLEYSGVSEVEYPRVKLLKIKYNSLEPLTLLNTLRRLALKDRLIPVEK